ncbi:MAG: peptidylprolyl isomerase [Verrucomicrobiota bacterium JB023]|nr:peptidylprolyl isomerase [Verrucomicrobiota bacterium JB023]
MRPWLILAAPLFLTSPLHGQIYADVSTTLGDFSLELDYENAPRTVANFITLAEGSRPWRDSATGNVMVDTPYYEGIQFHRVIADFMSQTGSQNGAGTDGPGYTFPDEVDNGLTFNERHLLAMANSGPNTNGSQFFITDVATTHLNGLHTIFGSVASGGSVVDAINNAPVNADGMEETADDTQPVTDIIINAITIRREGVAAIEFDEFAQKLPTVTAHQATLTDPLANELAVEQPASTTLSVYHSDDLASWSALTRYLSPDSDPESSFTAQVTSGDDEASSHFFLPSLTLWPDDANFPASLVGSLIEVDSSLAALEVDLVNGLFTVGSGSPSVITSYSENPHGYGTTLVIQSAGYVPFRLVLGADQDGDRRVTGSAFTSSGSLPLSGSYALTSEGG